ncbi:hypothetical protein BJ973_001066 [Actinoplanes tereljensis]|uniref:GAF domain-containing protein n=1 Tax=Paractinoplanes tereljensis TaxID=571912 RepID=A0A919NZ59_9ACTN|nr:GAF and ANTAR domain-containing protein [Actinoplanes tereljensis]GIF26621.1 GAF domain-containing protein [Actinoplanes tereljensis]
MADGAHRDRVIRLVATHGPDVTRLCDACVAELPGVDGAGLSVMTAQRGQHVRHTSDRISARIEELQLTLGEGPCQDAHSGGQPVLATDLGHLAWRQRWPMFTTEALKAGAAAVFALPLHVGVVRLGVIDLYRSEAGVLAGDELSEALAFADAAMELLLAEQMPGTGERLFTQHAAVHQATGMVSAQLRIPMAQAFLRLRACAYAGEVGLDEIARQVVDRRLRFTLPEVDQQP